jgi:hypothetical protein
VKLCLERSGYESLPLSSTGVKIPTMNQNLLVCCKNNQSSHALTQFIPILKRNARRSGKRGKAVGVRLCASGLGFGLWARFWTPLDLYALTVNIFLDKKLK